MARKIGTKKACIAVSLMWTLAACSTSTATKPADENTRVDGAIQSTADAFEAGDRALADGKPDQALLAYLRGIEIENSAALWSRVGSVHASLDNDEIAKQAFTRAIEADSGDANAQLGMGLIYLREQRPAAARPHLVRALELDPGSWRAHNGLGIIDDRDGNHNAAVGHYEAALTLKPGQPAVTTNLAYSHFLNGDHEQAARLYYEAAKYGSVYVPAQTGLGLLYARRGWYSDALEVLLEVQDAPTAYNDVGYIAMANGDNDVARQYLKEASKRSPTYFAKAVRNLEILERREQGRRAPSGPRTN